MTEQSRCPRCSRILFLGKDNRLPPHKVPATGLAPLTPSDAPWCKGI